MHRGVGSRGDSKWRNRIARGKGGARNLKEEGAPDESGVRVERGGEAMALEGRVGGNTDVGSVSSAISPKTEQYSRKGRKNE
jgi:hypothetical protein